MVERWTNDKGTPELLVSLAEAEEQHVARNAAEAIQCGSCATGARSRY